MHGTTRDLLDELADRLEVDLGSLEACWSEIPENERSAVIRRLANHAPGVARLLCPQFQRFGVV